jgi:hypothetical protein
MLVPPGTDTHIMKLQPLQNKVLRTIGYFIRRTPIRELHMALKIPYVYDYIKNNAGNKQKSYKIMTMKMFAIFHKAEPDIGSTRGLNLAVVKHATVQITILPF